MRSQLLLLAFLTSTSLVACKTASNGSSTKEVPQSPDTPTAPTKGNPGAGFLWVGCRPSQGECANSCADHRYYAVDNDKQCEYDASGNVGCYCRTGGKATDDGDNQAQTQTGEPEKELDRPELTLPPGSEPIKGN